jgi:hypothetical protein
LLHSLRDDEDDEDDNVDDDDDQLAIEILTTSKMPISMGELY